MSSEKNTSGLLPPPAPQLRNVMSYNGRNRKEIKTGCKINQKKERKNKKKKAWPDIWKKNVKCKNKSTNQHPQIVMTKESPRTLDLWVTKWLKWTTDLLDFFQGEKIDRRLERWWCYWKQSRKKKSGGEGEREGRWRGMDTAHIHRGPTCWRFSQGGCGSPGSRSVRIERRQISQRKTEECTKK